MVRSLLFLSLLFLTWIGCKNNEWKPRFGKIDYQAIPAFSDSGFVHLVIEIPAGTNHKIEFDKQRHTFENDSLDAQLRIIDFLPYPGNYGFIPGTLMDQARGGDGDPLDMIVIAESQPTGSVMEVIPVAAMMLVDGGALDTKLVGVPADPALRVIQCTDFQTFMIDYDAVRRLIESWFLNYKGMGRMEINGWRNDRYALEEIRKWQLPD